MPMIELTLPQGALDKSAQDSLMHDLTFALLRWEGAPEDSDNAKAVSWGYVDERPRANVYQGGEPAPEHPTYRVKVTVPQGALDDAKKAGLVAEATKLVLEAEGADPNDPVALMRVWVIVREVTDGNWGGAGQIFRLRDIAKLVGAGRSNTQERVTQPT